ncbi:MAG: acetate--CoA ligase family protein [Hyphomicrobiales bacterium]
MSPLKPLLAPRSIAFVGASARANTPGHDMMRMIRRGGFSGAVHAVNPNYREIEGYPCVPALGDLAEPPELAVLAVKNERLEEAMREARAAGVGAAVIFASGVLDEDAAPRLSERLAAIAREAGMQVCGPNCMGFYNDLDGVWVCGFPSPRQPRPGPIAMIAHSGSVFGALAHNDPRLRFALAVSPGQELTTTVADYLDYAVERPEVKVVALFIESARDPAGFRAALAKAASRNVPVVVLKVGRTEAAAAAALTHTGAIAGSDTTYQALFDQFGVIRVETLDELAATLLLFSTGRRAKPGGLVSIHDSGGERELLIDLAERAKVPFARIGDATKQRIGARLDPGLEAENPLDAWGTGRGFETLFEACFADLVADDQAAIGLFCADIRDDYYLADGYARAAIKVVARTDKPIAFATNYTQMRHDAIAAMLTDAGVPVLDGTAPALAAIAGMLAYRDFLGRGADPLPRLPPALEAERARAKALLPGRTIDEKGCLALLAAWGVPVVESAVVEDETEAVAAARRFGFPVVVKTAAQGATHKSDLGGVHLRLADAEAVRSAYRDLKCRISRRVTVARMIGAGVELSLGMVRDPQFGPVVLLGAGGTLIELLCDRCAALAPFGPATARRLLDRLSLRKLLDGFRGAPGVDLEALALAIARFSMLCADLAEIVSEIDVNPMICGEEIAAVDALVITRGES